MSTHIDASEWDQMKMANDLFPLFSEGRKRVTCRQGIRFLDIDELLFISTEPVVEDEHWDLYSTIDDELWMVQPVDVIRVMYTEAGDLLDSEAQEDGFSGVADLIQGMKRFYPDMDQDSVVTFIYFEVQ